MEKKSLGEPNIYFSLIKILCRYQGEYISAADEFVFGRDIQFEGVDFIWYPLPSCTVVSNQSATGVLSFSRDLYSNYSYSLVRYFPYPGFSYYLTYSTDGSRITFGEQPNVNCSGSNFQSVELCQNEKNPGYDDLYYAPPPQISVGNQLLEINSTTDFYYGVIIDTSIPYILLATNVYEKVVMELQSQIGLPVATDDGIPMCSCNSAQWPNLTLSFESGYAQMVLDKHNYVVTDSENSLECAVIFASQYIPVIGTMAQLDRNMFFDVNGSMLYFDQYSQIS